MNIFMLVGAFAVIFVVVNLFGDDDGIDMEKRMSIFTDDGEAGDADVGAASGEDAAKKRKAAGSAFLQKFGQAITPKGLAARFEVLLEKADVPLRANEFAGIVFLAGILPSGGLWLVTQNGVLAFWCLIGGFSLPFLWLRFTYARRLRRFNDQMLDTLTLLANAVKAGYSMVQAMEMVAKESPPPMGTEFTRVIREVSLGVTIEEALGNLKERVPSSELDLMVTVIMIQRQIGGNLSEILESIAHTIRERNKLQGMISALTAQGRMSGLVIGGLPFALAVILYIINPEYMSLLWTFSSGAFHAYYLIIMCVMMELVGFIIIGKITNVEV